MDKVIAIVGPTAVGKTEVAICLAESTSGEIVSADSMAVYRGMDIGTAKPDNEEKRRAVFHCIDIADPREDFDAGTFQTAAHAAIDDIHSRGKQPIVTGGSGLYVNASTDGIDTSLPEADSKVRDKWQQIAIEKGKEYVHEYLRSVDAESADNIHPSNVKRVIRAIEIYATTGRPASEHRKNDKKRQPKYPGSIFFGLTMDRKVLYERIEKRIDRMMEAGLYKEVERLVESGVKLGSTAMQGLGYKEIATCILGNMGLEEAVEQIKKNTRRFAKRQYTWFNADPRVQWIDVESKSGEEVSQIIKETVFDDEKQC